MPTYYIATKEVLQVQDIDIAVPCAFVLVTLDFNIIVSPIYMLNLKPIS